MAQSLKRASIAAPCCKKENHSGRLAVCYCAKEDKEKRMQHIQTLYMAMYRLNPEEQAM